MADPTTTTTTTAPMPIVDPEVEFVNVELCAENLESLEGVFLGCPSDHSNFKRRDEVTIDDLPLEIRHQSVFDLLLHNCDLTVHLYSPPTAERKEPKSGSGSVCYFSDTHNLFECHHDIKICRHCHIPDCPYTEKFGPDHYVVTSTKQNLTSEEEKRSHIAFRVSTNEHVVSSCDEAARTEIQFFFDSPGHGANMIRAQGVCLCAQWREQDKVHIVCVTDRVHRIQNLLRTMRDVFWKHFKAMPADIKEKLIHEYVILVSHPHRCSKQISFGRNLGSEKKISDSQAPYTETRYDAESCRGSSGGVVLGPGWIDGGPAYRVHCGRLESSKLSKSFWVVADTGDNTANYLQSRGDQRISCCRSKSHKAIPSSI